MTQRWLRGSRRLYRLLLLIYPRAFRAQHAEPMALMFGDLVRETARCQGGRGLIALWGRTVVDLLRNGMGERYRQVTTRSRRPTSRRRRAFVGNILRDAAFAGRTGRRQPALLVAASLTLAVGIGANVSIFAFVYGVLLQPLPLSNPRQLMMVTAIRPDGRTGMLGYEDVAAVRADAAAFSAFGAYASSPWDLTGVLEPDRVDVASVTAGFFEVLQWVPAQGRLWTSAEEGPGQPRVAVLTDDTWRRRFARDATVIGTTISLDDSPHTVIGVLRPTTAFPSRTVEFFVPPRENFGWGAFWLSGIGRLRPTVTIEQARVALDLVASRLAALHPELYTDRRLFVQSLRVALAEGSRPALVMLLAAVVLVLVVSVANVANLILTRNIGRMREFAIRAALGADRGRLVQQIVLEGLLLGVISGTVGLLAASWTTKVLVALGPDTLPRRDDIGFDSVVVIFAFGLAILVGVAVGTVSAIRISSGASRDALQEGGTIAGFSPRHSSRHALTVLQVAVAFVLLAGAGLLLKSFWTLARVDPGFTTENVVSFRLSLPRSRFPDRTSITSFHEELRSRLGSVTGITALASVSLNPFDSGNLCTSLTVPEHQGVAAECVEFRSASAGYFDLLDLRLLRGRLFTSGDDAAAPPRALINQRLADLVWPGQNPVGQRFTMWEEYPNTTVVGVVSNIRQFSLDREPVPEVYMPQAQFPFRYARYLVRMSADASSVVTRLREVVWELNPTVPISELTTMNALIANSISEPRFRTVILTSFAIVALIVSLAGVAAVVAYNVKVETRNIGVRIALGATRTRVVREMLGDNVRLVALGLAIGLVSAAGGLRVLRGFLFGVSPFDLAVVLGAVIVLGGLGTLACYLPARHASHVDPIVSLRT